MMTPMLSGVHHLTHLVPDLDAATAWYETVLGAQRLFRLDHHDEAGARFAVVVVVPGVAMPVQLRLTAVPSAQPAVTFSVTDRAGLDRWVAHLDLLGVEHSPVAAARAGFDLNVRAPGGTVVRLYTEPVGGFAAVDLAENAAGV